MLDRYEKVFESLQRHDVKYVVIGGVAAVAHGVPRATFDLDMLIDATPENASRLLAALQESGLGTAHPTDVDDLLAHEVTIFKDYVRIDVQTKTPGIDFASAWVGRITRMFRGQPVQILSRESLISSKKAAGRSVDLEDVRVLESGMP